MTNDEKKVLVIYRDATGKDEISRLLRFRDTTLKAVFKGRMKAKLTAIRSLEKAEMIKTGWLTPAGKMTADSIPLAVRGGKIMPS